MPAQSAHDHLDWRNGNRKRLGWAASADLIRGKIARPWESISNLGQWFVAVKCIRKEVIQQFNEALDT